MFAGSGFGKVHENEIPYLCNIYRKKEGIANSGKISAKQGNTNEEDFSQKLTAKKFLKFV